MADSPVELKVKVATAASAITSFVMAAVATVVPGTPLPGWLGVAVGTVVVGVVTFASSWLAAHTPRSVGTVTVDTAPPPVVPPQATP